MKLLDISNRLTAEVLMVVSKISFEQATKEPNSDEWLDAEYIKIKKKTSSSTCLEYQRKVSLDIRRKFSLDRGDVNTNNTNYEV